MKKLKVTEHECNVFFDITSNTKILSFSILIVCLSPLLCLFLHVIASILDLPLFQQLTNRECFCVSGRRDARSRDRHRWPFGGQQWWRESQQTAGIPLWLCVCVCVSLCIATHLVLANTTVFRQNAKPFIMLGYSRVWLLDLLCRLWIHEACLPQFDLIVPYFIFAFWTHLKR